MPTTKDLLNNSTVKSMICPRVGTTGLAVTGTSIDMNGIGRKILVIAHACNPSSTTTLEVSVQECTTTGFGVPVTLHNFATLDILKNGSTIAVADLAPNLRFVRAVATLGLYTLALSVVGVIYLERARPSGL